MSKDRSADGLPGETKKVDSNCPAGIRADFMRRWFAIAVSVGFATTVVKMDWLLDGGSPDIKDKEQFARLFVALIATLFSWEGYLLSISKKPLYDVWRFCLDVGLVFVYLVLLLTSDLPNYWLWLHAMTFLIYIVWDLLTIVQYPKEYAKSDTSEGWTAERLSVIPKLYFNGLIGTKGYDRGPIISLLWAPYFFFLYDLYPEHSFKATYLFAFLVFVGLVGYRVDKGYVREKAFGTPLFLAGLALIVWVVQSFS